jgi:hypothetical protein
MTPSLLRSSDFWSGLLFISLGAAGLVLGSEYQAGSAFQMGPGYFPRLISGGLILIGCITAAKAFRSSGVTIEGAPWRAIFIVLASLVAFGLIAPRWGLAPASFAIVLISGLAAPDRKLGQLFIAALLLTTFSAGVFIYGLGLTIPVFAWE